MTSGILICSALLCGVLALQNTDKNLVINGVAKSNFVPYERTFMKYHHRRKINSYVSPDYEEYDYYEPLDRYKRQIDSESLNENATETQEFAQVDSFHISNKVDIYATKPTNVDPDEPTIKVKTVKKDRPIDPENPEDPGNHVNLKEAVGDDESVKPRKSEVSDVTESRRYNVKEAMLPTRTKTTEGPKNICVHKYHKVAPSEKISLVVGTHSPQERDDELVASDKVEPPPRPYNATLPDGTAALVEECAGSCFTLWLPGEDGTDTVLGQGCWQWSMGYGVGGCAGAPCAGGPAKLPGAYFCCCSGDYCNHNVSVAPQSMDHVLASPKTASTRTLPVQQDGFSWSTMAAYVTFAAVAMFILAAILRTAYRRRRDTKERLEGMDIEKAAGAGSPPDALATGLLCVDNLKLIEHIGQGKFGSVWRGALGSAPVAVKLYGDAAHWQREAALYCTPLLAHPNILKYYGSDSRPTLTTEGGGRQQLIVVELCEGTLRRRLRAAPLTWQQFATLAHGLASALAHLHSVQNVNGVHKPCIVHRDVNSNNVLVTRDGRARLADLGLAQPVRPADARPRAQRITEAGTLRYLAPEALEGALDLAGARAALCAVDVFALGLVLWEMLWRTAGAHAGATPPYAQPYAHAGLEREPTLAQMQALVPRNKTRPPLPRGPVAEPCALKLAADTCEECWDHDAEARLTAVCVAERLSELTQLVTPQAPVIHDNNLHPPAPGNGDAAAVLSPPESDKNSNCLNVQPCSVTTPLLYAQPHIGRNPCLERNTHTHSQSSAELVHRSLKDAARAPTDTPRAPNNQENCLSVARVNHNRIYADNERSDRLNEIRSCPRQLDYVPNDVSSHERLPKQTNFAQEVKVEKPKWALARLFGKKTVKIAKCDTEVKLLENGGPTVPNGNFKTTIVNDGKKTNVGYANGRPSNLSIENDSMGSGYNFESPCTLSPPNRTLSPTMMMESQMNNDNKVFAFKELPLANEENAPNQIFAVIVPKTKCTDSYGSNLMEMHAKNHRGSSESIHKIKVFSSQSLKSVSAGHSESEDSTVKNKRLSCDDKIIIMNNSGNSSRASMELQYMGENVDNFKDNDSRSFDINTDLSSSSEDENLMLLSENGTKITMQPMPRPDAKKYQNDVLKEVSFCNKFPKKGYANFDNEFSDPHDKENLNGCIDNPVYLAAINGDFSTSKLKFDQSGGYASAKVPQRECKSESDDPPKSPKRSLKYLSMKRQRSLEHVNEIFSSSGDLSHLQNPAGRVKTPGDLPAAVRRARRDRALQKGRAPDSNRLSLYDDRMMFGNSL